MFPEPTGPTTPAQGGARQGEQTEVGLRVRTVRPRVEGSSFSTNALRSGGWAAEELNATGVWAAWSSSFAALQQAGSQPCSLVVHGPVVYATHIHSVCAPGDNILLYTNATTNTSTKTITTTKHEYILYDFGDHFDTLRRTSSSAAS